MQIYSVTNTQNYRQNFGTAQLVFSESAGQA